MDLISNDWKHKIRKKPREFFVKISCLDNKGTRKIKDLQKLSNKEIYFSFNLITRNTSSPLSLFHDQTL